MPGNEVGDRVHNFFGQENLYHGQHQLQAADGTWPMLTDNTWVGNQRQFAAPFTSNLKDYSAHQTANSEVREYGNVLSRMSDEFSHIQPNLGSELGRSQAYSQQKTFNGFAQGNHMLQTRQNEANILVGGVVSDRKSLTARNLTAQEAPSLNGLERSNLMELETPDARVSFDLFGGQQQSNGGHLDMAQSLQRQQSQMLDSQLMQQQTILSQIQGFQRQQQTQFKARDYSSMNQVSSIMRQDTGNHSSSSKVPVNEVPNHSWQHGNRAVNVNWANYGSSPVIHGSSSGLMSTSEHNHAVRMMGLIPQQIDQSPYDVHIPTARSISRLNSPAQMDKPTFHQLSNTNNSLPLNKHAGFPDQSDMPNETSIMRQNFQGKSLFEQTADQGLNGLSSEKLHHGNSQQGNGSVQESQGRQQIARRSETLHGKTEMSVSSSQYVATLDPTEEKFLYGSDDSLWDAFGRITTFASEGSNMLDGVVFDNGFPSTQSGTWSALMQSAVAETFSSTSRVHEEWSGPSSQNAESPNENQNHVSVSDSGRSLPVWVGSNMQTTSIRKSESCSAPVDGSSSLTINYCDATEHGESLQPYSSQVPYFLEEESRCLDQSELQKPFSEGLRISENVNHSSGVEIKANNILSSWTSEKRVSLLKNVNQHGKENGWNFIGSMSPVRNCTPKYHENQSLLQNPQSWDHTIAIPEAMSHATVMFKNDSDSHSRVEMLDTKCAIELPRFPQCYDEGEQMINGHPAGPLSSTFSANRGTKQQYLGPHDTGKDVDCSVKKGHNVLDKYRHRLVNNSQISESFGKSGLNHGGSEILKMEEASRKENSSDCFRSSISNHKSSGGFVGHLQSDVDERQRLLVSKLKSTSNVGRKPSSTRKFQYHPMGDLEVDAEPFNGNKHAKHSPAMAQEQFHGHKSPESGSIEQSKFGQADKNSAEVDKVNRTTRGFGEIPSHKMLSGWLPNKADSFDNFIGNDASTNFPTASQNMLDLLHKVDHHKEHGTATATAAHLSPINFNPPQMRGEESSGPIDQTQQFQSSASHGFGLQLGPPSQPLSISDTALSSHKSLETIQISAHTTSDIKGKVNSWLAPAASTKPFNSSHGPLERDHKYHTCPESLDSGSSLQAECKMTNQCSRQADDLCNRIETSQSGSAPDISGSVPQPKVDAPPVQNPAQESDWLTTSQQVEFSKVSSNEWVSVTTRQQPSLPLKSSHLLKSFQSDNNLEMNFSRPKVLNQVSQEIVNSSSGIHSMNLQSFVGREQPMKESPSVQVSPVQSDTPLQSLSTLQGKESLGLYDPASAKPATRDCEAFVDSPRPINSGDQQFSSLDQVQDINRKTDLRKKRFKSLDGVTDSPEVVSSSGLNNIIQEESIDHASLSSGDSKIPTFLSHPGDSPNANNGLCLDGSIPFQSNAQNLSVSNNISCEGGEHSGISPQMAPSWFDRYGSFKNGQMFTVVGQKDSTINLMNQSLPFGKPSDCLSSLHSVCQPTLVDNSLLDLTPKSYPLLLKEFGQGDSDLLSSALGNQSSGVRSQKRKTSTSELLPWHRELALESQRLQNLSLADVEWAQATNRLIEMMEDEAEMIDDGQLFRPKKRHTLTSQLMQQLLRPPPATFLSAEANLHYASVVYLVARFASSDACSAIATTGIETASPFDCKNPISGKLKMSAKVGDQLHKLMEDFISRGKKLEEDFFRMDKGVSILDFRVGCQDLEKFSVINRFAKFHSRGQVDGREASSPDATANSLKICPQRYVTAVPMPRNLPDRVQCLSL